MNKNTDQSAVEQAKCRICGETFDRWAKYPPDVHCPACIETRAFAGRQHTASRWASRPTDPDLRERMRDHEHG